MALLKLLELGSLHAHAEVCAHEMSISKTIFSEGIKEETS